MQFDPKKYVFAGSRQRVSPFPTYFSYEIMCHDMKKNVNAALHDVIMVCKGTLMIFFVDRTSWESTGTAIAKEVQKNPSLFAQLTKAHEKDAPTFINFTKKAAQTVSRETPDIELFNFYKTFETLYRKIYVPYAPVWVMGDALSSILYQIILEREPNQEKASEVFSALTQEPSAMVALMERKALLELACHITKHPKSQEKRIQKHVDNYFWVTRDYEDPVLTYDDVSQRLQEMVDNNPAEELNRLENSIAAIEQTREKYLSEYPISKAHEKLFQAMRDGVHLKELRKRNVSIGLYYFDKVLEEIGRRLFLSIRQVRFMRVEDVQNALLEKKDLTHEINDRINLSLWHSINGLKTDITTGKKAEQFYNTTCVADKNTTEFSGTPVSPGIARGPVKIVMNPDECGKVEKGDIIVTVQVVPSFSTAIIKAAGIVCDGGTGITSHPATLAREAEIPCVIQTRFAREVLKDGDMVEVDGYKGVVRKLDSKNQK